MSQPTQKLALFSVLSREMGGLGNRLSLCLFTLNAENIVAGKITEKSSDPLPAC